MIPTQLLANWTPVAAGAFGNGEPSTPLVTPEDYLRWLNPTLVTNKLPAPRYVLASHNSGSGSLLFAPADGGSNSAADYEYRLSPDGKPTGEWTTCPGFLLSIDNQTYLIGKVEVRAKAKDGYAASDPISNRTAFIRTVFPFEITPTPEHPQGYYMENHILKIQFTMQTAEAGLYMHIVTNSYLGHPFDASPRALGFQLFEHDLSQFIGSTQRFYLETNGGYRNRPDLFVTVT